MEKDAFLMLCNWFLSCRTLYLEIDMYFLSSVRQTSWECYRWSTCRSTLSEIVANMQMSNCWSTISQSKYYWFKICFPSVSVTNSGGACLDLVKNWSNWCALIIVRSCNRHRRKFSPFNFTVIKVVILEIRNWTCKVEVGFTEEEEEPHIASEDLGIVSMDSNIKKKFLQEL